jgi:hypothetical protein
MAMEQAAAEQEAERLNQEHPERDRYRWFARRGTDGWGVARVAASPRRKGPLTGTTESGPASPHPAPPSEPNPYWGAG